MVSSPLIALRDAIVTLVEALAPPTDATIPYRFMHPADGRYFQDGQSFNRFFRFELMEGGAIHDFGRGGAVVEHKLQIVLRLSIEDLDPMDQVTNEAILIQRAINEVSSWPTGIDFVSCDRYKPRGGAKDDVDAVLDLTVRTQET